MKLECPECRSTKVMPLEAHEGEWEEGRVWRQTGETIRVALSFICSKEHAFDLIFVFKESAPSVDMRLETFVWKQLDYALSINELQDEQALLLQG